MNYTTLLFSSYEYVAKITIHRPDVKNALCMAFFEEFDHCIARIQDEKKFKLLLITGSGDSFASGADLSELVHMSKEDAYKNALYVQQSFQKLSELEIPVLAAINGYCIGGGLELAMACDIRVAASDALFAMPESKIGICPGGAGTQRLSKLIGSSNAMFYLLSGEKFTATQALQMNLISRVYEKEEFENQYLLLADKLCSNAGSVNRSLKHLVNLSGNVSFSDACEEEAKLFSLLVRTSGQEGMNAFFEKRKPEWE